MNNEINKELYETWNNISKELNLNEEKDFGKINLFYLNSKNRRNKMNKKILNLKENILNLKKEQKYLNLKEKKNKFIENKLDEITIKLKLGKFFELTNLVKNISFEMEMKFEEYHMIYDKNDCYTFASDIFTIDVSYL